MTTYQKQYHHFGRNDKITVHGEIVHVDPSPKGLSRGVNVLVRLPEDDKGETYYCDYERNNGKACSREVDTPDESCWQHGDDDE